MEKTKQESDYMIRVTAANDMIRAFFISSAETVDTAARIHQTSPVMSAALGRLLTAGAMMGAMLKNDSDLLTLQVRGDGDGGGLLVTADRYGRVKGYANQPAATAEDKPNGKLNVSGVIGKGTLTVIKDMGVKEPFGGTVELVSGEIAEDIAYYFAQSEQTPTVVALGVLVDVDFSVRHAGGLLLQVMPEATDDVIDYLEKKAQGLDSVTTLFASGHTPESLAEYVFGEVGYTVTQKQPVAFTCNCAKEKMERALLTLGADELKAMKDEDGGAQLICHFCTKQYHFTGQELLSLIDECQDR